MVAPYIAFNIRRTIRLVLIYLNAGSLAPLSLSKTLSRFPIYQCISYFSSPTIQNNIIIIIINFFFFYPASLTKHHPLFHFPIFRCLLHLLKIRKRFLILKFQSKIFNSFLSFADLSITFIS
jgi:hypothetical protein